MGFGDALKNSMSGKLDKACIQIFDLRVIGDGNLTEIKKNDDGPNSYSVTKKTKRSSIMSPGMLGKDKGAIYNQGRRAAALTTAGFNHIADTEKPASNTKEAKEAFEKKVNATRYTHVEGGSIKSFWVQFNPSELVLYAQGGGRVQKTSFAEKDGGSNLNFDKADSRITLSVKLYFDTIDLDEAFAGDYLNLSASSLAKKGIKALKGKKKRLSVQERVEGFSAALRNKFTRYVIFTWGKLEYSGVVTNVNARYTMFDKKGAPIRGEMQLEITLIDMQVEQYSLGSWYDKYLAAFADKGDGWSLGNSGQNLKGGLLNLGH